MRVENEATVAPGVFGGGMRWMMPGVMGPEVVLEYVCAFVWQALSQFVPGVAGASVGATG